jgi:glycosyltransferase involved in cell wall biosynthesis
MKISICIPVYNFDVRELVSDLKKEIDTHQFDAEIILIDDGSETKFKQINKDLNDQVDQFIFLDKNIGRSLIRNLFLTYTKGDYLLFLDCDGKIINKEFLENYIQFIQKNPSSKVIYGGRDVSAEFPDQKHFLRWKFATERENLPIEQRTEKPYLSFQTNNFIIKKEVLEKIRFNSEFQKYGYEDLLFAMDLKSQGIGIDHINNPIFNNDLEDNEVYLEKVKESIDSLSKMLEDQQLSSKLAEVKLVKAYNIINKMGLTVLFKMFFKLSRTTVEKQLLKGDMSLRYLDFYKLGLISTFN